MTIEQLEPPAHQHVVVRLVPGRQAQFVDARALGDGDPDLRDQDALDVEGDERRTCRALGTGAAGVGGDLVDDVVPPWLGQVVAHVREHHELRPGDRPSGRHTTARRDERVEDAVDDERRDAHAAQVPGSIGAGDDRPRLAGRALRAERAVERLLAHPPRLVGVEVRPGDQPEHLDAVVDGVIGRCAPSAGAACAAATVACDRACGRRCVDMIEVRLATLSGWRMASAWAIIPPIDMPTTCARSMPRASSRPAASSAMSSIV